MNTYQVITLLLGIVIIALPFLKNFLPNKVEFVLIGALFGYSAYSFLKNGLLWSDLPIYLFCLIVVILALFSKKKGVFLTVILVLLLAVYLLAKILFPAIEIPKSTGDYLIGTQSFDVIDENRMEKYNDRGEKRQFKLQVTYPTDDVKGLERVKWLSDGKVTAQNLAKDSKLPYFVLDQLANVNANSYLGADVSNKATNYPLIIISHGWRSTRNLHQDFAENLASHGYIVLSIEHTYGSVATQFDNGNLTLINHSVLPFGTEEFLPKANQLVNTYAGDISKAIDFAERLNQSNSRFKGTINLDRIGLVGHSTGGGADVRAALADDRIKALVGLDAWVEPIKKENIAKGLQIPALFFRSEQWQVGPNNDNLQLLSDNSAVKPLCYQIDDTTHYDFSMVYMYSPAIKLLGFSGDINSSYLTALLNESMLEFFEQNLGGNKDLKLDFEKYSEIMPIDWK